MRFFLALAFVAIASAASILKDEPDEVKAVRAFAECTKQALDGGLPSANIPDHNPLIIPRNYTIPLDLLLTGATLKLHSMKMTGITEFEFTNIVSVPENNPVGVYFDYSLYWESMKFLGVWELNIDEIVEQTGDFSIDLQDAVFSGNWNMTLPSEDREEHLDNFLVEINVSQAETNITNTGIDGILNGVLTAALTEGVNHAPYDIVSVLLQKRLNDLWIANATRIDAVLENCKL